MLGDLVLLMLIRLENRLMFQYQIYARTYTDMRLEIAKEAGKELKSLYESASRDLCHFLHDSLQTFL